MSLIPTPEQKEMEKFLPKLVDPRTEITWINCAKQMPLETKRVILRPKEFPIATTGLSYFLINNTEDRRYWEWTSYTDEKWEELNK